MPSPASPWQTVDIPTFLAVFIPTLGFIVGAIVFLFNKIEKVNDYQTDQRHKLIDRLSPVITGAVTEEDLERLETRLRRELLGRSRNA